MAQQMWSFIRNFSNTKYYSAAQQGLLTGAAPFSFGAIFATVDHPQGGAIFGNAVTGVSGFGALLSPLASVSVGTRTQTSGPIDATTGLVLANATDLTSAENLANAFKSGATSGVTTGGEASGKSPMSVQLVHITVTVPAVGNQVLYINGQAISTQAVALVTNANPVLIGNRAALNLPMPGWIAGCYYHNAVYTAADVAAMHAACVTYKDIVSTRYSSAVAPAYMWSVKRGNFDCRANWVSDGSAVTPITMVQTGTWVPAGISGDVLAADLAWMQI